MDGRAFGIFIPNARTYSTGSLKSSLTPRALATAKASEAQPDAIRQVSGSSITSRMVRSVTAQVPE